jgi:hypothetical protein
VTPEPRNATPTDPAVSVILRLCRELASTRMQYANLLAAARATLSAARDGEPDPLYYLVDELAAQHGRHDLDDLRSQRDEVGR